MSWFRTFQGRVVTALIVIALGCAYGIYSVNQLSKDRRADGLKAQKALCDSSYDGRKVLRDLIIRSARPVAPPANASAELRQAYINAAKRAKQFKKESLRKLPLPNCSKIVK